MLNFLILMLIITTVILVNCYDVVISALLLGFLYLIMISFFLMCGLEFLALATYLIYLGAVIVLLIFVLMMLQVGYSRISFFLLEYHYYLYELIVICTGTLIIGFKSVYLQSNLFVNNVCVFFDMFDIQTTLLLDFGILLYQMFFCGIIWIGVLLTLTLCGLLLILSYRNSNIFI